MYFDAPDRLPSEVGPTKFRTTDLADLFPCLEPSRCLSQRLGNVEPARPPANRRDLDVGAQTVHERAHAFSTGCAAEEFHHRRASGSFPDGPVARTDHADAAFPTFEGHHACLHRGLLQPFAPAILTDQGDAQSLDTAPIQRGLEGVT